MYTKRSLTLILFTVFLLLAFNLESVYARDITGLEDFEVKMEFDNDTPGLKVEGIDDNNKENSWNSIYQEYRGIIYFILGLATLTVVSIFVVNFIKLGTVAGNSSERTKIVRALLWTFAGAAALGGITLFLTFFTNILK